MTMSKSQNAFALRNFDKNHILQRPILKKFVQVDGDFFLKDNCATDDEIIRDLSAITDDVNRNELNLRRLRVIWERLIFFQTKTIDRRHLPRLVRFKRSTVNPELKKRANDFRDKYDEAAIQITITAAYVEKKIEGLEKSIQQQNRNLFASRLKKARQDKKISQRDLSDLTKINRADIGLYETAKKFPSLDNFIKILRCTGVSADWLLGMERI